MVEKVHELTDLKTGWQETTELAGKVNRALDSYTATRLRRKRAMDPRR